MPATRRQNVKVTTVRIPGKLYDEARGLVRAGVTEAVTLNDFLIESLVDKLKQLKRAQIDAQFAGMKHDAQYQKQARAVADEFAKSDWETLQLGERKQR